MKIINIILWSVFSLLTCQAAPLKTISSPSSSKGPMDQVVRGFIKTIEPQLAHVQGAAIAIIYKGQVIYQKTVGYEKNKTGPITDTVLFPLASVSKPVSATVLALLVKRGKIRLDDSVSKYVPGVSRDVKVADILSHSSGYGAGDSNKLIEMGKKRSAIFAQHLSHPPAHAPAKVYSYHNLMFSCAEDIGAKGAGSSWQGQVKALWQSLGVDGFAACTVDPRVRVASPHGKISDQKGKQGFKWLRRVPNNYPESVCSSAGLYASLKGMIQFLKLHLGYLPHVLSKQDLAPFYRPYINTPEIFSLWGGPWPFPVEQMQASYGLGWRLLSLKKDEEHKSQLIFHGGYLKGVKTFVGFMPAYDIGVVILTNQDESWALRTGIQFWGQVIKKIL